MKYKEVSDLSKEELKEKLSTLRRQLMELELKRKTGIEKPHTFKLTRRDIARVMTVLSVKPSEGK
jgi:ribosomal protein L29